MASFSPQTVQLIQRKEVIETQSVMQQAKRKDCKAALSSTQMQFESFK